jgi:isoleucyl-tRNA synthetase
VLATVSDSYRKLRNTVRYLLGALADFEEAERIGLEAMPPLERFVLHRLWALDGQVRAAYGAYRFSEVIRAVSDFCSNELSALFFDIRKDSLYCDRPDSARRRACRTVMDAVFERLTGLAGAVAPVHHRGGLDDPLPGRRSNCLRIFPETPETWRNDAEANGGQSTGCFGGHRRARGERRESDRRRAGRARPRAVADPALLAAFDGVDPGRCSAPAPPLVAGEGRRGLPLPEAGAWLVEPPRRGRQVRPLLEGASEVAPIPAIPT